jgi:hypothetical protein
MTKRTFTCTRETIAHHPELFASLLIEEIMEERKTWKDFEVILFDGDEVLYQDVLKARDQFHASDVAFEFAQAYYTGWNSIHVNPVQA